jgi:phosphoglycerol transferase MdoB-like AlkP superfamily enzyme
MALSSAYTVLYAMYETRHEAEGGFRYASIDDAEVFSEVQAGMNIASTDFTSLDLPTLHLQQHPGPMAKPKNLVIIIEESLGAEFVGSLGGLDLTPHLDALSEKGLWFTDLYATGTRSVRGLEAVVSGFTPTPARSVVKLGKSQRNFFTLAELLGKAGYDTGFIYGGEAQFDNMRRFFMNNGFDEVIDKNDYPDPAFTGSWGVSDEDLFGRAHEEFIAKHDRPFFSLVFTSTNHSPFEYPEGRIELFDEQKNTVNNAVKYADYALGEFFEKAQASDYWDNTVFLVVADHNSRVYGSDLVPVDRFHIPGLILGGSIVPAEFTQVASQIDLGPTLLSLIGVAAEHPMIGHDLTRPEAQLYPGRAIMQFNGIQAYMEDDRVAVLQKDLPVRQFKYKGGHLLETDDRDQALMRRAIAHAAWSSLAYEKSLYRLPADDGRVAWAAAGRVEHAAD